MRCVKRLDLNVSEEMKLAIEDEFHRLHQLQLKLRHQGKRPKAERMITVPQVTRLIISLGLEAIHAMSYEAFEAQCRTHSLAD